MGWENIEDGYIGPHIITCKNSCESPAYWYMKVKYVATTFIHII